MRRQGVGAQFGAYGTLAQLGMGEIQVVFSLRNMIGKFIADRKPQTTGRTARVDYIQTNQFGFLTRIQCEMRRMQRRKSSCR